MLMLMLMLMLVDEDESLLICQTYVSNTVERAFLERKKVL